MSIRELSWTPWSMEHIGRHGITPGEVEEIVWNNPVFARVRGMRYRAIGKTHGGRFPTVFVDALGNGSFFVVTARDAPPAAQRTFRRR